MTACSWRGKHGPCPEDAVGAWTWGPDPYHPEVRRPIGDAFKLYCEEHGQAFERVGWHFAFFVGCWSCGDPGMDGFYIACGECGHTYTRWSLVMADHKIRRSIFVDGERVPWLRSWRWPRNIWVCPCCCHDL